MPQNFIVIGERIEQYGGQTTEWTNFHSVITGEGLRTADLCVIFETKRVTKTRNGERTKIEHNLSSRFASIPSMGLLQVY